MSLSPSGSPPPLFPLWGLSLHLCLSLGLCSSRLSLFLPLFPPPPSPQPPSTSLICQVSGDPKGGEAGVAGQPGRQSVGGCQILGLLPNGQGMEAGPQSLGKAPLLPLKPPPSTPPLRSLYNYVGLRAWWGPGCPGQAGRWGDEDWGVGGKAGSELTLPSPCSCPSRSAPLCGESGEHHWRPRTHGGP